MNAHKTIVCALANQADPTVPEDVIGGALELAIGEAQAIADSDESLVAYALVGRLTALRSFIGDAVQLEWKPGIVQEAAE
jgi:hypothetical protein